MNKNVITSITLLIAGVIIGVVICIVCLTSIESQKAANATHRHNAGKQLAARANTFPGGQTSSAAGSTFNAAGSTSSSSRATATSAQSSAQNKNAPLAHSSTEAARTVPTIIDPVSRTVQPSILHQAAIHSAATQGMVPVSGSSLIPVSATGTTQPGVVTTTYIIQEPAKVYMVPGQGLPSRAVDSPDAMPMAVGRNGLLQNPCVDPVSSYGRAYNRTDAY